MILRRHLNFVQARLVQLMQKLSPDHFDWATSIVLGRYPGAVQVSAVDIYTSQHRFPCCKDAARSSHKLTGMTLKH